ncbi:MAG: ParB/RepB/Spo0J family partition protein [Phycisphaerae bacterium]|nr:ParB/RepB/Spo0J family partition protein [Phycisphaerae bacterium]MCZ2400762.1 ParB/RepB/Spo0J family partition protein [Phycisphaerae bacterium]NUQ48573.1 ParB/RepB/Spo0J family partition protein [Phycisphaerae bacterium]
MSKSTPRLGKGLSAIIGARQPAPSPPLQPAATAAVDGRLLDLSLDLIVPNAHQPRTEFNDEALRGLAESIRQTGLLQPVLVRAREDGRYELVAGERRWRAARLAGLATIPAIERRVDDAEALECALIENLQREDLGPLERAAAYERYLADFGSSVERLAERLGESRSNVANYLRFLKLPDEVKQLIRRGELGMGQARAVAALTDPQQQLAIARLAARRNLSVRQVETLARESRRVPPSGPVSSSDAPTGRDRHFSDVQDQLSKLLGTTVLLRPGRKKNSGRIIIRYSSLEQFDRIAERLGGKSAFE